MCSSPSAPTGNLSPDGVEDEQRGVGDRRADRHGSGDPVLELVDEGPDGGLGRAVHVGEPPRQGGAQLLAELLGKRLAAHQQVPDGAQRLPIAWIGHQHRCQRGRALQVGDRHAGRRARPSTRRSPQTRPSRRPGSPVASNDRRVEALLEVDQVMQRGEHLVGVDAEVDQAGDLVDADRGHRARPSPSRRRRCRTGRSCPR